ncbi:MAG: glycosyltransferase family 4 protein [Vicinamibacteria bacterium]|nr:glycosyltransferase family 4 protein [Vicinamibacteria bacterium]
MRPLSIGIDARELQGHATGVGRYLRSLLRVWPVPEDRLVLYFDGPVPEDPLLLRPGVLVREAGPGGSSGVAWQLGHLPRCARRDPLDVFFAPAYTCPLGLAVPRVTAVHDLSYFSWPRDFRAREALRRRVTVWASVRTSTAIVALAEFGRRELAERFPAQAHRVRVVPPGADDDLPPPPAREAARARLGARGPLLISVGSIFNRRRVPELLQALCLLRKRVPTARLELVGENRTWPRLDLPALVRELGLDGHVRLRGFVSEAELADLYAAADVAVFLSAYEGFGLPALEAMARGVPVVASRAPAMGEVLAGAACLVDPERPHEVADAVTELLGDAGAWAALRAAGSTRAAEHSWARSARALRELLAEVAEVAEVTA